MTIFETLIKSDRFAKFSEAFLFYIAQSFKDIGGGRSMRKR